MKLITASAAILAATPDLELLIEQAGRVCYKSEERTAPGSAEKLIRNLMDKHHESVLEHGSITVRFICDRGVSHELVRHRIASFSQESTRYCNYGAEKHGGEVSFIDIRGGFPEMNATSHSRWIESMGHAEAMYLDMIRAGSTAQEARSVLPNSVKTEVVMTANPREWRHVFKLRASAAAHPQMREVINPLLETFKAAWPILFGDL